MRNKDEQTEDILAFRTTDELYALQVMTFGPTNAPACMQRFMNHIFASLRNRYPGYFENYMDDCIVMTGEGEDELYREVTIELFKILREHHLCLRPAKCEFEVPEIDFLGMHLNQEGITIDPTKIAGLTNWPCELTNVKEVQKVLGVLGYQ